VTLAITPQGITTDTLQEVFDRYVAEYKAIYGEDIDLSQNTPDGQRIGIESKSIADIQAALLSLYSSLDIDFAEGEALNRAIKYAGIVRRTATYSTWDINVTASVSTTLYQDYTIKDDAGQEWIRRVPITIPSGITTVSFESKDLGAINGLITATLEQQTVIPTITLLEPDGSASVGREEETELELRTKRNRSIENPSYSTVGGLTAKIYALDDVTDVYVYENSTNVYDAALDLDANSIWAVVEGGLISDVAETIAKQKTAGTGLKGSVTGTYIETLPNGRELTHEMIFDRPTIIDVYVTLDATRTGASAVDADLIKNNLAAQDFLIGDALDAFTLYDVASTGLVGAFLSGLEISDDNITFTSGRLDSVTGGKYKIQVVNITVTEIIP